MSKPKLSYFDFPGSRGEECRLALHVAGVDFEDDRIPPKEWAQHKENMPFGAMPILELEGRGKLSQSNTILRVIGRNYDLLPKDNWEAAKHEELMDAAEDLRMRVSPTIRIKDPEQQKTSREELANGYMQIWGKSIESRLEGGPFISKDQISVADIKLYIVARWFISGTIDHIPSDVFKDFPKLTALYQAVHKHPKIAEWNARFA